MFINNEFVLSTSGSSIDVLSPYDERVLASLASAQSADVDRAVKAAEAALERGWSKTPPAERGELLRRLADLVERDTEQLATIEAVDAGILFNDSKSMNIKQAVESLRYNARLADQSSDQMLQMEGGFAYTIREPFGICAAIVPWNAPL